MKLIEVYGLGTTIYLKLNETRVVDIKGHVVDFNAKKKREMTETAIQRQI